MSHKHIKTTDSQKQKYIIFLIYTALICLWGGIYDFCAAAYGTAFCIGLILLAKNRGKLIIPKNLISLGLAVVLLGFCISSINAQDKGTAVLGIIRIMAFIAFWILWCNFTGQTRERIWNVLPEMVSLITVIAMLLYFIPAARDYLFRAGRLGGVFQYSNTYAVLLLVTLVVLAYRKRKGISDFVISAILIASIMFCGSRSVFVLSIVVFVVLFVKSQINRKKLLAVLGISLIVVLAAQYFLQLDMQRLLQLTLNSSTLNGRFLYWQDAVSVLLRNPLGLGYMGYFFLQPQFQTGNYVTKYVHNDFLQFGLDAGIVAMAALLMLVIVNIFSENNRGRNRFVMTILALHAMFDFDLQYGFMFCLLLMCMDTTAEKAFEPKKLPSQCLGGVLAAGFTFFAAALGLSYAGRQEASLTLYPYNTFALEELMMEKEDANAAEKINERNGMLASAHEYAARAELKEYQYEEAYQQLCDMLKCAGYESYYYNQAVYYLSMCLEQAVRSEDMENTQMILEKIQGMPEEIEQKEAGASTLAWKINDKPEIELQEEIKDYIQSMSEITLK